MDKNEIRRNIKARKHLLDDNERNMAAKSVFDMLEHTAAFILSEHILLYHSLPDELSTLAFIDKWHETKHFYLPRVNGVDLDILPYDRSHLALGAFQIEEPEGDNTVDISQIEMIVVPGVAIDRNGNRIGRGKGYYDRLLEQTRAITVGVGYGFQLVEDIPAEPHDIAVDYVITEHGIIRSKHKLK
jgi:5-formyltetrahydrofolate cyclo-ligase